MFNSDLTNFWSLNLRLDIQGGEQYFCWAKNKLRELKSQLKENQLLAGHRYFTTADADIYVSTFGAYDYIRIRGRQAAVEFTLLLQTLAASDPTRQHTELNWLQSWKIKINNKIISLVPSGTSVEVGRFDGTDYLLRNPSDGSSDFMLLRELYYPIMDAGKPEEIPTDKPSRVHWGVLSHNEGTYLPGMLGKYFFKAFEDKWMCFGKYNYTTDEHGVVLRYNYGLVDDGNNIVSKYKQGGTIHFDKIIFINSTESVPATYNFSHNDYGFITCIPSQYDESVKITTATGYTEDNTWDGEYNKTVTLDPMAWLEDNKILGRYIQTESRGDTGSSYYNITYTPAPPPFSPRFCGNWTDEDASANSSSYAFNYMNEQCKFKEVVLFESLSKIDVNKASSMTDSAHSAIKSDGNLYVTKDLLNQTSTDDTKNEILHTIYDYDYNKDNSVLVMLYSESVQTTAHSNNTDYHLSNAGLDDIKIDTSTFDSHMKYYLLLLNKSIIKKIELISYRDQVSTSEFKYTGKATAGNIITGPPPTSSLVSTSNKEDIIKQKGFSSGSVFVDIKGKYVAYTYAITVGGASTFRYSEERDWKTGITTVTERVDDDNNNKNIDRRIIGIIDLSTNERKEFEWDGNLNKPIVETSTKHGGKLGQGTHTINVCSFNPAALGPATIVYVLLTVGDGTIKLKWQPMDNSVGYLVFLDGLLYKIVYGTEIEISDPNFNVNGYGWNDNIDTINGNKKAAIGLYT